MTPSTVVFSDGRKVESLELPSFKDSKVEMYISMLVEDQREIYKQYPNADDDTHSDSFDSVITKLMKCIKSWNFVDESGKALPITFDNIKSMPMTDMTKMLQVLKKMNKPATPAEKKN